MARPNNAQALSAHIDGMRQAKAKFQALPKFMQEKRINVNSATAAAVALGAEQRVQSSPSINTRMLYNHINWSITKTTGQARAGVTRGQTTMMVSQGGVTKNIKVKGIIIPGRGGSALTSDGARVVRPTRYAHLIEFGTVHQAAEPFMIPATNAQKDPHLQRWRAAGRELERDMAGLSPVMPSGGGLL